MAGRRPDFKLRVKDKASGNSAYVLAAWKSDRGAGFNVKLEEGWKLISPNGKEITSGKDGNAYLDLYQNDNDGPSKPDASAAFGGSSFDDGGGFGDDNIPF